MKGLGLWALAVLATPGVAATPWNVARSGHFEVWSNAPADTARTLGAGMERLRAFFIGQLGIVPHDVVRVICFASTQEYLDYRIRPGADGFSLIGPDGQYIVLHSAGRVDLRIPAHEYAHLLIHSSGWKLPEWLAEGISEVVSSVQFGERYSFIGGDLPGRSPQLKTTPWMTPAELFELSLKGEPDSAREPLFYSQSWAVAEMLIVSPTYAARFPAFLAMLAKGSSSQAAIEGVYGVSADVLFRQARERVVRGLTPMPLPAVGPAPAVREEAASWFDARVTLARLHHAASQNDRAEAAFRELAAERPGAPEVPAALGLIALDRKDPATAIREWSRALALGLRDADLCYRYATLADDRGLDTAQVRTALERAVAIRPDFDAALFRLGRLEENEGHAAPALVHYRAMQPPAADRAWLYYTSLAGVLLDLGRRAEAKDAAMQARRFASTDKERNRALELAYLADTELTVEIAATDDGRREFRTVRVPVNAPPRNPFIEAGDVAHRSEGRLRRVECADDAIRLIVSTNGGDLSLAINDPSRVQIRNAGSVKFEFVCGPQQARPVLVEYTAGNILRGLELR